MTEPSSPQGADVHVPPPLVYAAPLALAWAVDRLLPWRMPGSGWRKGAGWVLVVAGEAIATAGVVTVPPSPHVDDPGPAREPRW